MAVATVKMPEEFALKLSNLIERTDKIIDDVVTAGGKVALDITMGNLKSAVSGGSSGELVNSLGLSPPDIDNNGVHNVKVGFNEPRLHQNASKGKRSYNVRTNAMIANVLEYGRPAKDGSIQKARPFIKPSKRQAKTPVEDAMRAEFDRQVESI